MAEPITIVVGTMTGTAEMVAEEMSDALAALGHDVTVTPMDKLTPAIFAPGRLYLICTSTYGQGDVPDNAMALYEALTKEKPALAGVRYGVFSLGDRTYAETFNFGGKKFDKALAECGAARVGEVFTHDASAGTIPEDEGVKWVKQWATLLDGVKAAA